MQTVLKLHPDSRGGAISRIAVDIERRAHALSLRYQLGGDLSKISVPAPGEPVRADHLWQHTCFEAFIGVPKTNAYYEFNFAPSRAWAAYRFDIYRNGMEMVEGIEPHIATTVHGELVLSADLALAAVDDLPASGAWRMALAAVIEGRDGALSYWALKHRPGKPDFHHPDCFALEVPPPSAT
jgi:hypothetical protein